MSDLNRRDVLASLAALAWAGSVPAQTAPIANSTPTLNHSQIFSFEQLPTHTPASWGVSRPVIQGKLATGELVEVHETTLLPGQMPHPPHRHTHSEFLLIREGKLEVLSDGQHGLVEPGGVIFTASGVLHSLKNIGDGPANYFVVGIGLQKAIV